jgi:hypothetical protein
MLRIRRKVRYPNLKRAHLKTKVLAPVLIHIPIMKSWSQSCGYASSTMRLRPHLRNRC